MSYHQCDIEFDQSSTALPIKLSLTQLEISDLNRSPAPQMPYATITPYPHYSPAQIVLLRIERKPSPYQMGRATITPQHEHLSYFFAC